MLFRHWQGRQSDRGLVPQDVKVNLDSIDPNVPCALMCRYLLLYVYKTIECDSRYYRYLIDILSKLKRTRNVCSQIKEQHTKKDSGGGAWHKRSKKDSG